MFEKLKQLTLKKVGKNYMLVEVADNEVNMTNVYSMNSTAAWLWEHLDTSEQQIADIADKMCSEYEVDRETALTDITSQLQQWKEMGLIK
ncbi:MAG: PqqD family protein [Parabacteroides sp.]|nr:PqqD family protein [Parabacteroides sp.]